MKHPADRTAGLNSELAVEMIGNRYNLILAGARRMRELSRGDMPKIALKFSVHFSNGLLHYARCQRNVTLPWNSPKNPYCGFTK